MFTHLGNGVGTAISVWDHDIGGLFESESGVALLDLELELKLWNNTQHISDIIILVVYIRKTNKYCLEIIQSNNKLYKLQHDIIIIHVYEL